MDSVGCVRALMGTRRSPAVHDRRLGNSEQFWVKRWPRKEQLPRPPRQPHSCANWRGLGPDPNVRILRILAYASVVAGGVLLAFSGEQRSGPAAEARAVGLVAGRRRQQQEEA